MKKQMQSILCIVLVVAVAAAFAGCGARPVGPQEKMAPGASDKGQTYDNGGVKLTIPEEYADLVAVELPADGETLFTVTEKASLEAAQKTHPDNIAGAGWLFGISRVSEEQAHELLARERFGRDVIARSGDVYYLVDHPTDVRIERQGDITPADMEQWSALHAWINDSLIPGFVEDNGLTACRFSSTSLDILLARIAWQGSTDYQIGGLAHGLLRPLDGAGADFARELLESAYFSYADRSQAPDGEYLYLNDTQSGVRYEFFMGEGGAVVRESVNGYSYFYEAENAADAAAVVDRWYEALSSNGELVYDMAQYMRAQQAVFKEFAGLDQNALDNFVDEEHPELPWYTAVIANPVRNTLFYAENDFNGDGIPEMVIAAGDENYQQPMAIYAFDGEKMVYLCKDQALGERSTVSYVNGEFVVFASGSAATGGIIVYTIGPDGYSTQIRAQADYEYSTDGKVTLTVTQGELSQEEFDFFQQQRGEFPELDYYRFAPEEQTNMTGLANPWSDAATAQEAAAGAGLEGFTPPEYLNCLAGDYTVTYRYMEGLAEAVYTDGTNTLVVRKGVGEEDISGDYNSYAETRTVVWKALSIQCAGNNGQIKKANWYFGGFACSLTFNAGNDGLPGLEEGDITSLVNQIQ